ncbi:MAG: ATP-dependent Clp protease adaptor ClpS [Bacteroidota bacterium]
MNTGQEVLPGTKEEVEELSLEQNQLVLFNDDVNTFDFVIDTLVEVCDHDYLQAEQCAFIVHYKGKCDVKSGGYPELEPLCSELLRRGLTAEIQ